MISAPASGSGKSSVTCGLMRLLTQQGYTVAPYKTGPDYIDASHHSRACRRPSYNLDSWMCSKQYIASLFRETSRGADIAVAEGVMGLFDGAASRTGKGSTAEIAKLLRLPVILVIDARAMAQSAAAIAKGFAELDPDLPFLGVIANRVNSAGHEKLIKDALTQKTDIPFLGRLPYDAQLKIADRHLGLHTSMEQQEEWYDQWAAHIEKHIDVKTLVRRARRDVSDLPQLNASKARWASVKPRPFTVAVARDIAFQFVYQDTLDLFRHYGGTVRFFSPINDKQLPAGTDWVYLPGGYPELHAKSLAKNKRLMAQLRKRIDDGIPVVAECGGLMYLGKDLIDESGKKFNMTGVFDYGVTLHPKKLTLGYRNLKNVDTDSQQVAMKGHEFHYSQFSVNKESASMMHHPSRTEETIQDGWRRDNCRAFYTHLYWGASPKWLKLILDQVDLKRSQTSK